jgi:hypothetical protein
VSVTADERSAALDTVYLFHRHIDRGQATRSAELVAPDADFTIRGQRMQGHAAVLDFLTWREAQVDRHTLHVLTSSIVTRSEPSVLSVESVLLMHARDDEGVLRLGDAYDIVHGLVLHDGRWLIRDRTMSPVHAPPPAVT